MVFTVLCLGQLGNALAIRSQTESVFSQGLLSNRPMAGALALTVALQMATLYVPFLNPVFRTAPLSATRTRHRARGLNDRLLGGRGGQARPTRALPACAPSPRRGEPWPSRPAPARAVPMTPTTSSIVSHEIGHRSR
jgi:hypothetical protein